ncbi:PIN domain-containing protein [Magnetospirillum moscoviense]|uniref:PIN domain-containing protein n=1 Tax=Magnetospirillum moscoviense TaxID=1437059 RepID=A0A178MBB9_9PROT|nr:PIN domain-containing protein [Magnetospirillum moscoviense]OAN46090.1 PIN domain-containing protein [Magnetospirillum moscoviense]
MAGRFTVVLDACVLYPAPLRDLLMQLTLSDLFRARWSEQIHAEWMNNLIEKRPELKREDLERVRDLMNLHARDSLVSGHEPMIDVIENCPDANDRHVIAAAYHCRADAIVTFNLKDFPAAALEPYGLEVIHPDDFVRYQFDLDLARVLESVRTCRARLKNPPKTVQDYLDTLEAQRLPKTVSELRKFATIL